MGKRTEDRQINKRTGRQTDRATNWIIRRKRPPLAVQRTETRIKIQSNSTAIKDGRKDNGRVSSEDEKHVCSHWTRIQREHIFKNFNCPTREWTNVASDRVALSKRDRLRLETPPQWRNINHGIFSFSPFSYSSLSRWWTWTQKFCLNIAKKPPKHLLISFCTIARLKPPGTGSSSSSPFTLVSLSTTSLCRRVEWISR